MNEITDESRKVSLCVCVCVCGRGKKGSDETHPVSCLFSLFLVLSAPSLSSVVSYQEEEIATWQEEPRITSSLSQLAAAKREQIDFRFSLLHPSFLSFFLSPFAFPFLSLLGRRGCYIAGRAAYHFLPLSNCSSKTRTRSI